jgi:hypothetical protein
MWHMRWCKYERTSVAENDPMAHLNGGPALLDRHEFNAPEQKPAPVVRGPLPARQPHTLPKSFGPMNAVIKSAAPAEQGVIVTEGLNGIPTRRRPGKLKSAATFEAERKLQEARDRTNG